MTQMIPLLYILWNRQKIYDFIFSKLSPIVQSDSFFKSMPNAHQY